MTQPHTTHPRAAGRFLRVDGVPLHAVVEGDGPPVVLSAGLAMAWFDWDEVAALLVAAGRTVIRFDRPGHGLSAPATTPPTAAGEAHRIAGLLDTLGVTAPVTVVGHSLAGFHAEAFARLHPDRTAALVLVDSSVEESPRTLLPAALRTGAARALGRALTAAGIPAALGPAARRAAVRASRAAGGRPGDGRPGDGRTRDGRPGDPAARDLVRRCYRTGRVWRGILLENSRYPDTAAELLALRTRHPLPAPATVLVAHDGGRGRAARRWLARQAALADRLGARFEVAEPAGHLVMLDRPHQVARAVRYAAAPGPPAGRRLTRAAPPPAA
ncbi:alpha/beta hydrolase [Streptomyces racemochromogenes]|uniref:Alpha/beta hydrolase n=1 Tax=Streptomyces racemochromogenes TaxID=67353 RepID=A0ABW7PK48_9ACTN